MERKQLSVRIDRRLHKKYLIHAIKVADNLTDWVKTALENQYKTDKQNKK